MKVSIIIPTYNEEKVTGECLKSLSLQSHKGGEIIVVDDGSTDTTLHRLSGADKIIKQSHKGAGAARNLGAKQAKGEILVFADADMTFDKNFIRKLIEPIEKGVAIGTFSREEFLANKDNIWAVCWNLNRGLPKDRMHPKGYPDRQPVFRAILKKEFEKAGGFDERAGYTDDWSLAQKLGVEAVAAPGAVFYHKNPDTLKDVFIQSRWMAKRRYKFGLLGFLTALTRVSLPVSILAAIFSAVRHSLLAFLPFKIVSDLGQFIGILEYPVGKVSK
ncbi:MAG: hypothetical protein UX13_C0009G0008 [Candidatus Woesebacteria bacterium GW2011_GWB1_45_5]|uniref:Glycosyltransferase 2-like domain-containing protein n=1 Tax=Candidatus Woesebacteria bacterium GW2011_GWB1_45_5 TaxID=1618581 RepID=A0A0G1MQB5_9BACT|nr:MAG: hypothetical protein UX13_C0009G0008 [Candidatus Woesebacteria bacterium GW2011_GWB1_45_5]